MQDIFRNCESQIELGNAVFGFAQQNEQTLSVCMKHVYKTYNNGVPVLENLSMHVPKGTIYGLLGSSGCGKTTILSCIVGLQEWDSGQVLVFGNTPGARESGRRIGYMPQDLPLYKYLSILELLEFYGSLYGMNRQDLKASVETLSDLLKLPTTTQLINTLSGGQQRRVSLAIALLHSPDLVILDEPTVGLDPLLRQSIWDHLRNIVTTMGTTIIITTHYIEEARQSDVVGVMRNGHLLIEDAPLNLLKLYDCNLLEDVVIQLCKKDKSDRKVYRRPEIHHHENCSKLTTMWKHFLESISTRRKTLQIQKIYEKSVQAYAHRETYPVQMNDSNDARTQHFWLSKRFQNVYAYTKVMLLTDLRFPAFLLFILLLPAIHGSLTLLVIGSKVKHLHVGIVNHEVSNRTKECISSKYESNSCQISHLSCKYINEFQTGKLAILNQYDTEEEALEDVQQGKSWGYLTFPENYTESTLERLLTKQYSSSEIIEGSMILANFDHSNYVVNFFMQRHLYQSYFNHLRDLATSCNFSAGELALPFQYRTPVYGFNEDDFTFMLPGSIISSYEALILILMAITFVTDYKQGTLTRARVAGLSTVDVILSHIVTQQFVTVSQLIIWTLILHFGFNFVLSGSVFAYIAFCVLLGAFGAVVGLLIAISLRDIWKCLVFGALITPVILLFGGLVYTTHYMSKFWQSISNLLPANLPAVALRSIMIRGVGFTHPLVWPGVAVLLIYIIAGLIIIPFVYKKYCR